MVVHKRKKNVRQRGSKTHGWGAMKKHRGAGNRGGRGMAGTGKRADTRKPSFWKEPYFGKRGFHNPNPKLKSVNVITIKDIEDRIDCWKKKGFIKEENNMLIIELSKLGFTKLLSNGNITKKLKIIVPYASKRAVEKVQKSGGEVIISSTKSKS